MGCNFPVSGFRRKGGGFTTNRKSAVSLSPMVVPCGRCTACRLEHSRQWAVRCVHESKMYKENCVVSLSYNPENLPESLSLVKRHLQLFTKRLHNRLLRSRGRGVRYYAAGEYGEVSRRPHYHAAIFDFDPPDKKFYKKSKIGTNLYTSKMLEEIWGKGFVVVGEMDFESAAYISRYIVDKMTGDLRDMWYSWIDADGVWHDVIPEFAIQSRGGRGGKGGIGRAYFDKYGAEVLAHDSVIVRGREVRPPRYYSKLMEAIDPKRMEVLKRKRRREAMKHRAEDTPERRRVKETHAILTLRAKRKDGV